MLVLNSEENLWGEIEASKVFKNPEYDWSSLLPIVDENLLTNPTLIALTYCANLENIFSDTSGL